MSDPIRTMRLLRSGIGWRRIRYLLRTPVRRDLSRTTGGLDVRQYSAYDDYVAHQRTKLELLDLNDYDRAFREALAGRLAHDRVWAGRTVLCLAARIGSEVRAFHDVGAFAVGVDLNPGERNEYVLHGDFHELVFPDASVDVVYTNSLDHALDLKRLVHEVDRVLRPGGTFLVDAQAGATDAEFDEWAATVWQEIDDLVCLVEKYGLRVIRRRDITAPWRGEELTFRRPVPGEAASDSSS
ncbi:methyltransferase domain-containing protein [Micromonospora sp. LOL_023]|uniref:methyltransferase domain-containing protein n=1 Tax=Micromonospora sp. LOL_023 TaxID=3345418 RepID=UPI003A89F7C5